MANILPVCSFDDVYQIETTDPVLGGPGGISNRQSQQLANRDEWLKKQIENIQNDPVLSALATLIVDVADKMIYSTGENTFALSTITAFARTLLDDTNASAALSTLGVSGFIKTLLDDVDAETARGTLGVDVAIYNAIAEIAAVRLTGNQTIDGVKTFNSSPVVPDGSTAGQPVHYGQFQALMNSNGYQQLPGGLIIQWGSVAIIGGGSTTSNATFPITFPAACLHVFPTIYGDQQSAEDTITTHSKTSSGVTFTSIVTGVSKTAVYLAIGY